MTLKSMKGLFFVFGVGLYSVSGSAYGDYPSPRAIPEHPLGYEEDVSSRFKQSFNAISREAETSKQEGLPDPRRLVGEADRRITLPGEEDLSEQYPGCCPTRYYFKDDFFCNIEGLSVFNAEDIDALLNEPCFRSKSKLCSEEHVCKFGKCFQNPRERSFHESTFIGRTGTVFLQTVERDTYGSICFFFP